MTLDGSSSIDAIIFDAEGVVIDTEAMWDKAQEEFLRRRGVVYDRAKLKPLLSGRSLTEATEILQRECRLAGDPRLLSMERMELVQQELEGGVGFITGFRQFFDSVQSAYKTCIATAMAEDLLRIVDRWLGLSTLFAGRIYTLAAVGYRSKPNPDLFLYAAERLGAKPSRCLVIEDAPQGIEAAGRAGMKCLALTTTYPRQMLSNSDLIADSFAEMDFLDWRRKSI